MTFAFLFGSVFFGLVEPPWLDPDSSLGHAARRLRVRDLSVGNGNGSLSRNEVELKTFMERFQCRLISWSQAITRERA
jgi:hypothetical protein